MILKAALSDWEPNAWKRKAYVRPPQYSATPRSNSNTPSDAALQAESNSEQNATTNHIAATGPSISVLLLQFGRS